MKVSKFLWMAVLGTGLALSSCNNEVVTDGENNQNGGDAYMSMTLQFPEQGASTYAEEASEVVEQKVEKVTVVFFETSVAGVALKVVDLTTADFTTTAPKTITKAMKVVRGDYDVVVLVNAPANFITITENTTTKTDLETKAAVVLANLTNTTDGFFMTNATGYKRVYASNFQTTADAAVGAPVPLKVERAVAKVVVMGASPISVTGGTVSASDITWAVDVKNTEMYWMRKQTYKLEQPGGSGTPWIAGAMEVEADYTTTGREYLYAEDPNFAGHSSSETGKFDRISDAGKQLSTTAVPGAGYQFEYVPENTMQAIDQFRNVSTSVVIKLIYRPTGITDPTTNGYYIYNGKAIEYSDMQGYITTPSSIPPAYTGLAALLAANTITPTANEYKHDGNTLTFYQNGVSYFNVPIKHFALQTESMAYGRYGVVRNNIYKLTINSIKGPGKFSLSPEDWEDDEESYISVEFEVTPWYVRTQGIEL